MKIRNYKARAIVISRLKYGDNSLVVNLLTDTLGRQTYLVGGIRSARSHGNKAAHYQPMGLIEIEGYEVPNGQMHRIREVRNLLPLSALRLDARKGAIVLFMAEVIHRLVREVEPNSALFDFVAAAIEALDGLKTETGSSAAVANFHLWFLVRLSSFLGFYPGNEHAAGDWFDIREGLFTPRPTDPHLAIEPTEAAILARLMELRIADLGLLQLCGAGRTRFLGALIDYLGYHLDIGSVESLAVLRAIF